MSALAAYALSLGKRVGGSDRDLSESGRLKSIGAALNCGGTRALVGYDAVVYTDAVARNNEELRLARTVGKPVISRGKLLAEMSKNFRRTLAVCGCHGKTTCTAMLASVFFCAGKRFAAHIGGYSKQFSKPLPQSSSEFFKFHGFNYRYQNQIFTEVIRFPKKTSFIS